MSYKFLREAIELRDINHVKKILAETPSYNLNDVETEETAPLLNIACRIGDLEIVRLLHQYGAKINMNNEHNGLSPLTMAIQNNRENIVDWLILQGVDVNEEDGRGNIPLVFLANRLCQADKTKALLHIWNSLLKCKELDVNQSDSEHYTALYLFAQWGEFSFCEALMQRGANSKDYEYFGFTDYVELILQKCRYQAKQWLQDNDPQFLQEEMQCDAKVLQENIAAIFETLIETERYAYAEDLLGNEVWAKVLQEENTLELALKKAAEKYISIIETHNYNEHETLLKQLKKILFLISLAADYHKENVTVTRYSTFMVLVDGVPQALIDEIGREFSKSLHYQTFQKYFKEARARKMLGHRFGLKYSTKVQKHIFSVEGTRFLSGVLELKYSYKAFLQNKGCFEKIKNLLMTHMSPLFAELLKKIQFQDYAHQNIIDETAASIDNIFSADWYESAAHKPKMMGVMLVPVSTYYEKNVDGYSHHVEAFALFCNRLLKMNRGMGTDNPGLEVYQTDYARYDQPELSVQIRACMNSLKERLDGKSWSEDLELATNAKFLRNIDKKGQEVGNCGWATAKLLVYAAVYAAIFQCCKRLNQKDKKADEVAILVANQWYKIFTEFDRCYALDDYLASHHGYPLIDNLHYPSTVHNLGKFLKQQELLEADDVDYDREMLTELYQKQVDKLMRKAFARESLAQTQEKSGPASQCTKEFNALVQQAVTTEAWKPYQYAIEQEDRVLLERLLKQTDIPTKDKQDNSLLHQVAKAGKYKLCLWLIQEQWIMPEDFMETNYNNNTAFHVAIYYGHLDIAAFLLNLEPQLNQILGLEPCLRAACEEENIESIEFILNNGGTVPKDLDLEEYSEEVQNLLKQYMPKISNPPLLHAFNAGRQAADEFELKASLDSKIRKELDLEPLRLVRKDTDGSVSSRGEWGSTYESYDAYFLNEDERQAKAEALADDDAELEARFEIRRDWL